MRGRPSSKLLDNEKLNKQVGSKDEQRIPSNEEIISKFDELRKAISKPKYSPKNTALSTFLEKIKPIIREAIKGGSSFPHVVKGIEDVYSVKVSVSILSNFCKKNNIQIKSARHRKSKQA